MAGNTELLNANKAKADEFYTLLSTIENEMKYYKDFFKNKIVFCNCDDPYESNFFKYFALKFNELGLKKLITTCYAGSPVVTTQLSLFDVKGISFNKENPKTPYKIEINEVSDENKDGAVDLADVEHLIKNKKNILTLLKDDGDFRSKECVDLLKQADVIVTNPPFSLFREYIALLFKNNKKFIILGNKNAITYKEVFPLIKDNKLWLGASIHSGGTDFIIPKDYTVSKNIRIDEHGNKIVNIPGPRWFTNVDYEQRYEDLILYKRYNPEEYPKYDNYDAIEVSKTVDIPVDYDGAMGVPITFLDKYNPNQFEILDARDYAKHERQKNKNTFLIKDADGAINGKPTYARIVVRKKERKEN